VLLLFQKALAPSAATIAKIAIIFFIVISP